MSNWSAVRLTKARQVAELQGVDELVLPSADIAAIDYYQALRSASERLDAIDFIGHALPRFDLIAWAAHILEESSRKRALPVRDRQALDHALRWLGEGSDANRRSAFDTAQKASSDSAEKLLALAVFFSGGSISMPDMPPVLPHPAMAARMATNAIKIAAYRTDDSNAFFDAALVLAETVADQGAKAIRST